MSEGEYPKKKENEAGKSRKKRAARRNESAGCDGMEYDGIELGIRSERGFGRRSSAIGGNKVLPVPDPPACNITAYEACLARLWRVRRAARSQDQTDPPVTNCDMYLDGARWDNLFFFFFSLFWVHVNAIFSIFLCMIAKGEACLCALDNDILTNWPGGFSVCSQHSCFRAIASAPCMPCR